MFRKKLKFALRNLAKNKLQTFTNVIGLTIGITGAIVTFITLQHFIFQLNTKLLQNSANAWDSFAEINWKQKKYRKGD